MRLMIAALAALWMVTPASASFTQDDRYFDSRAPVATPQKAKMRKAVQHRAIRKHRVARTGNKAKHRQTVWSVSRLPSLPHDRLTLTSADEQPKTSRETTQYAPESASTPIAVHGPRPRAWCGWFMGKLLGLHDRKLWLARNWAHVGTPAAKQPGVIVVWRHHVGKITAVRADGAIKVLSGNDGRAVRDRWRSARGVIAYRAL